MALVSVIIPAYNVEAWIDSTIASVVNQSLEEWEIIVINNGSADSTVNIVEKWCNMYKNIKLINSQINHGASYARNIGVDSSCGEWIFFLDGDDMMCSDAIQVVKSYIEKYPSADWIQGGYIRDENGCKQWSTSYANIHLKGKEIIDNSYKLNLTNVTAKFINKNFIDRNKLRFVEGITFEDTLWCSEAVCYAKEIVSVDNLFYHHRIREGSVMKSDFTKYKVDSIKEVIIRQYRLFNENGVLDQLDYALSLNLMFLVKNLYMSALPRNYKKEVCRKLYSEKLNKVDIKKSKLPPFMRLLGRGFVLPCVFADLYFFILTKLYKVWMSR